MTLDASHLRVFARERKNRRVIEPFQAISPVVARETRIAHLTAVVRDELRVLLLVAIHTRGEYYRGFGLLIRRRKTVTRAARHRRAVKVAFVLDEQIAELIVRKIRH